MLNREAILAADDLRRETVEVPEWGGSVCVRVLTATEKVAFAEQLGGDKPDTQNFLAHLAALSLCDDAGGRLFDCNGDVEILGAKSAAALERVCEVAQRLNGLTADAVETTAKNSDSGQ